MDREAGIVRYSKKLTHAARRARQRAKRRVGREKKVQWGILPARAPDGTPDVTPHVASWNLTTEGAYLGLGGGFIIIEKDEGQNLRDKIQEYRREGTRPNADKQ